MARDLCHQADPYVFTLPFASCVPWAGYSNFLIFHRNFMRDEMMYINIEKTSRHRESAQGRQDSLPLEMEDKTKTMGIPVVMEKRS